MAKNILLTGSGGFLGGHLKNHFNDYNLLTPRSFELDLLDKNAIENYINQNNIDFIIHCASCGVRILDNATLEEVTKPNLEMFNNLASFVNENRPMITIGSGAEYDKSRNLVNVKELDFDEFIPKDPYGYSKYLISKEIEKNDNILNLRVFGIYGVNENKTRVTACILDNVLKGKSIVLNRNVKFSFIYIVDFCKVVRFFVENKTSEKFINVASSDSIQILDLAKIANKVFDKNIRILIKNEGLSNEYTCDNSLLLNLIPDIKFTSYEDGFKDYYKNLLEECCGIQ